MIKNNGNNISKLNQIISDFQTSLILFIYFFKENVFENNEFFEFQR